MALELSFHMPTVQTLDIREKGTDMLTHSKARHLLRVPKDATATIIRATFVDSAGAALDLSSATGAKYFHASDQAAASVTYQGIAAFTTDGTDGKVEFPLTATEVGTVRTLRCEFEVQAYLAGNLVGEMFLLEVIERAAVGP